jgi:hypothetical protein
METDGLAVAKLGKVLETFQQLYPAGPIAAGEPTTIQMPLEMKPYVKGSQDDQFSNTAIAPTELQPPGMEIPAFRVVWRNYKANASGTSWPYYVYLAQQKAGTSPPLMDAVNGQIAKAFPGTATTWEDISFVGPDGVTQVPWKKLSITKDMAFGVPPATEKATAPSTLQFFVHNANGWEVLVGIRIPEELDTELKFTVGTAAAMLGTVSVPAPAQ